LETFDDADSHNGRKGENSMKYARTVIISALLLAATSLAAQCQERQIVMATIPFAFTVENTPLPAGTYTISTVYTPTI
jgi:hypothetical protein